MNNRTVRAALFMAGDDEKKILKGAHSDADAIILDLEDAVAPANRVDARLITARLLGETTGCKPVRMVRVNSASTVERPAGPASWVEDLDAVLPALPDGIVIPKAEDARFFPDLDSRLSLSESKNGLSVGTISVWPIIESAKGLINVESIATASNRIKGLIFGAEDYCASTGAIRTIEETEVLYARSRVVCAASAFDLQVIDTVYLNYRDSTGLESVCNAVRVLGFSGKLAIHPMQIPVILKAFSPGSDEIAWAERLLAFNTRMEMDGVAVYSFEGKMIDRPILVQAKRILGAS